MAEFQKIDMSYIWATLGDVTAPDAAKINQGWGVEVVPRQWWNWMQNRVDNNVAYMLQKGFPEWDATTEYIAAKSYVQRSGIVYKAVSTTTGVDPSTALPSQWVVAFATYTASLMALGGITPVENGVPYYTASGASTFPSTAYGRNILSAPDSTAVRAIAGSQAAHVNLTALSGVTAATNMLPYFSSGTTMATTSLSAYGRSFISAADAPAARTVLGLGTAAVKDATTSNMDSVVGRLLQTGDFGIGGTVAPLVANIDQIVVGGFYSANTSSVGGPISANASVVYIPVTSTNGVMTFNTTTNRMYVRTRVNSVWGAWYETYTTNNMVRTTSNLDSTRDRVVAIGDHGIGSYAPVITEAQANALRSSGFYSVTYSDGSALPFALSGYIVSAVNATTNYAIQEYTSLNTDRKFFRTLVNNVWGTWKEYYTTNNSGQLTSAIIASIQPTLDAKQDKATVAVADGNMITSDPNTDARPWFLTSHANAPSASAYWFITQTFYGSNTASNSRSQIATMYNAGSGPAQTYARTGYVATAGGSATWTAWIRLDNFGLAPTASPAFSGTATFQRIAGAGGTQPLFVDTQLVSTSPYLALRTNTDKVIWFQDAAGSEQWALYNLSSNGNFYFRAANSANPFVMDPSGSMFIPNQMSCGGDSHTGGNVYAGGSTSYMQTNGDIIGPAWNGGSLYQFLLNNYLRPGDNLAANIANISATGGLGTYALMLNVSGQNIVTGGVLAGSGLRHTSNNATDSTYTPLGTWRCMGFGNANGVSLWARIT